MYAMRLGKQDVVHCADERDELDPTQERTSFALVSAQDEDHELSPPVNRRVSMVTTLAAISEEDSSKSEIIRRLSRIHDQNLSALILIDLQKIITEPSLVSVSMLAVLDDLPFSITLSSATTAVRGFPLIFVNKEFEHITGYSRRDILGGPAKFLQCSETNPARTAELRDALQAGQAHELVILNRRKDGIHFHNLLAVRPLRNRWGRTTHVLGLQMDISEEKASEREIECMEERLSLLPSIVDP